MEESPIKAAVTEDVARELARKDPQTAGNWILSMPEGEAKQTGIKEVSKIWSRRSCVCILDKSILQNKYGCCD